MILIVMDCHLHRLAELSTFWSEWKRGVEPERGLFWVEGNQGSEAEEQVRWARRSRATHHKMGRVLVCSFAPREDGQRSEAPGSDSRCCWPTGGPQSKMHSRVTRAKFHQSIQSRLLQMGGASVVPHYASFVPSSRLYALPNRQERLAPLSLGHNNRTKPGCVCVA